MEAIKTYFPDLTPQQLTHFEMLKPLYEQWNAKINVISRKDTDFFYQRHVLHSLAIAKVQSFLPESQVLDVGTGGGFPGVPLAILFPKTQFMLVDSIGKKIKVVEEVVQALGLTNVTAVQTRVEQVNQEFDFIVSRAVTQMPEFVKWVKRKIKKESKHSLKNGILYLKGGDLTKELAAYEKVQLFPISDFFSEEFFETKKVVYLPLKYQGK
ncbi:16S rRNA (guanine(527)-N(7))-methyltransferase RsmG [Capnocytophaga canimorsus]|uniref:Ribosomal RNA small subunit methyltransferase G n=1 Tax=Capnocytophaga canimorsus TaxID=28188 RepID=A0A0B7HU20_9FLAO|nr:16S rRNA (guanine(527)-N(7))-methyltransferase RsmG [Capnocytophaga canimorsus]ATA76971.1 16S rRNA methyltransferase G [Capnocytophaga canimorsus]ATA91520.1 16S rRNA methyltransferase G [Capnocytophaga canimorsus]AWL78430.1 16S rRNA (guanine(527)-N(7))-methyltransferase RsmG [Capnocytophaga canimorsus]MDT9499777.1 16S rRNA (guanine(527)-N(7))-methyltransferase RsmG [Capnocytophaga canimorsus]PJI83898.1 16S rRNA (guanine527-N7)-methyltransferase [Capnocytophaga canimorsus]